MSGLENTSLRTMFGGLVDISFEWLGRWEEWVSSASLAAVAGGDLALVKDVGHAN